MDKNRKTPSSIYSLILTTIAIVSWVAFSIYQALVKPQPVVVPPEILEPLDPNLDPRDLDELKGRFHLSEEEILEITPPPKAEPTGSPLPTNIPFPTNTASPTTTPVSNNQ